MPARKRRTRSRRARNSKRARQILRVLVPTALLLAAGFYWRASEPRHRSVKHKKEAATAKAPERAAPSGAAAGVARIAERYNDIVSESGGSSVWLKRPAGADPQNGAGGDSSAASAHGEALALAPAVPAIVAGLKRQAAHDGLTVDAQAARGSPPVVQVTLEQPSLGARDICAWRIREVPRLYRAAIVIDDLGQDMQRTVALLALRYPLTFSVLPHLPASRETSAAAAHAGHEVILHLPMQPMGSGINPGQGAILVGMDAPEVARIVDSDLDFVPDARGVNNHMGSRATSDPALMAAVMKELAARHLYFIDSRTAPSTVAYDAARQAGIPAFYRSVFLDDTETVDYTLAQLRSFRALVERQGAALAIGHPHPTTITALASFLPEFESADIELVPASQLAGQSEVARLSPGAANAANR